MTSFQIGSDIPTVGIGSFYITGEPAAHDAELAAQAAADVALAAQADAEFASAAADTSADLAAQSLAGMGDNAELAAASAVAAGLSATSAHGDATAAQNSATTALSAQLAAGTSASGASASAIQAGASAANSGASATAAGGSALAAAGSAGNAFTSETNAATSAGTATTKAANAATSETNAAASAASVNATATAANRSSLTAGSVHFTPDAAHAGLYYLAAPTVLAVPSGLPANAAHRVWVGDPSWVHPADGAAVASIRNGGTVGGDLTATGTAQPIYRASDPNMNGLPTLIFDGIDDCLTFDIVDIAQPYWLTVIFRASAFGALASVIGTGGTTRGISLSAPSGYIWGNAGTGVSSGVLAGTTPHLAVVQCNGATSNMHIDGGSVAADLGALTVTNFRLGMSGVVATPLSPFAGSIAYAAISTADPLLDVNYPSLLALARGYGVNV